MSTGAGAPDAAPELGITGTNTSTPPSSPGSTQPYYPRWWKLTGPVDGRATIDCFSTSPVSADTTIYVFDSFDRAVEGVYYCAQNDDALDVHGTLSQVTFDIVEGHVYYIKVGMLYDADPASVYGVNVSSIVECVGDWITLRPLGKPEISEPDVDGAGVVIGPAPWQDDSDSTYAKVLWRYPDAFDGVAFADFSLQLDDVADVDLNVTYRISADTNNTFTQYLLAAGVNGGLGGGGSQNAIYNTETPTTYTVPMYFGLEDDPNRGALINFAKDQIIAGLTAGTLTAAFTFSTWDAPLISGLAYYYYVYEFSIRVRLGQAWGDSLAPEMSADIDRTFQAFDRM